MNTDNYYCLTKKKPVFRGMQHLFQLIFNTILIYYYYSREYSLYYYIAYQFQLICSVYYHFSSDYYKYDVAHEKILQKWDHFGINVAIFVGVGIVYNKLGLFFIFPIHLTVVALTYYFSRHLDATAFINIGCMSFILPWYLATLTPWQIILLIFAAKFAIVGVLFYLEKSFRYYYRDIYVFGHHELYHLFTAIAVYIYLYLHN